MIRCIGSSKIYEWYVFKQEHQTGDKITGEFTISPHKADSKRIDFEIFCSESPEEARFQILQTAGKTLGRYLEFVKEETFPYPDENLWKVVNIPVKWRT